MAEYTISIDADVSEVLAGFAKIGQAAQRSGTEAAKGLADPLAAVNSRIGGVLQELKKIQQLKASPQVDAQQLKEAEARAIKLREELRRLNAEKTRLKIDASDVSDAADGFRLLDGVVQGVAFSLSNAVIGGVQQAAAAIGGLINAYAQLDTVIRQAAAASGGPGDYDKLASTINRVGIDAAGTTDQVAALSLELARGGMTADQQAQSLSGIVRGAEATATSYDRMGQIVSATLTAFGLNASETTRVVDALVQGANASATDVSGLGEAFKLSAPAAKLLGVNVEGLATAVGLFTNAGITASEAGTALRNGLSQLAQAAPKNGQQLQGLTGQAKVAADTVKQLGLDIYTASGQLKPMEDVLLKVKKAMAGMTAGEQTNIASKLFGGLDDAAKWLAVLSQSDEKIKAMATSMANSKGATDRNRDAMQGFQLTMQQLTGTLDTLGKNVGKIAAAALLPLVQAANSMVGAVSNLPEPVKDAAIALGLLTGAIVTATTAWVVFQRALQASITQQAIAATVDLARSIVGVTAVLPGLLTQVQLIGQINVGAALASGLQGAKAAIVGLAATLQGANFAQFISGASAAVLAIAPMALAIGAVTGAVVVWQNVLEGANKASEEFSASQKATDQAIAKLSVNLSKVADEAKKANSGFLGLGEVFRNAKEGWTLIRLVQESEKLDQGFNTVYDSAMKFAQEMRNTANATDAQKQRAKEMAAELQAVSAAYQEQAARAKALAAEEARLGNKDSSNYYQSLAIRLGANADALDRLKASLSITSGAQSAANTATIQAISLTSQLTQVTRERIAVESQLQGINNQIETGQALLNIATALQQREQARSSLVRASLDYQISKVSERYDKEIELMQRGGFTERQIADAKLAKDAEIKRLKDQQDQADRQMIAYKAQAMEQEQQMARAMLLLNQEKARDEANLEALTKRGELLKLQGEQAKAKTDQERATIQQQIELKNKEIEISQNKLSMLGKTQPMERAALGIQQDAARATLQAEGASKGVKVQIDAITKSGIDKQFGSVASNMRAASGDAKVFYEWLNRSASLPGARWSGGPVEAGGEYRINELGQEAFLSAGRLSLIDAAPNSIWRAPSEGVVIPAGVTARIKAQAAVPVGGIGGSTGVAELAIEVGKLRQEVGNLARRDWSVRVTQRTGPTGSQVLRTLLS